LQSILQPSSVPHVPLVLTTTLQPGTVSSSVGQARSLLWSAGNPTDNHKDPSSSQPRQCKKYMEMHECMGNCGRYAVCIYGVFWPRSCPSGMRFDELKGHCVRGTCNSNRVSGGSSFGRFRGMQTRRPSPMGQLGPSSYYGRLINRFGFGRR